MLYRIVAVGRSEIVDEYPSATDDDAITYARSMGEDVEVWAERGRFVARLPTAEPQYRYG